MAYTGYRIYTKLLKVVDGGPNDGQALDNNNELVSESGLPQSKKDNINSDPDYVAPVIDFDNCSVIGEGG